MSDVQLVAVQRMVHAFAILYLSQSRFKTQAQSDFSLQVAAQTSTRTVDSSSRFLRASQRYCIVRRIEEGGTFVGRWQSRHECCGTLSILAYAIIVEDCKVEVNFQGDSHSATVVVHHKLSNLGES